MIKINKLKTKPTTFRRVTGIYVEKFDELLKKLSKGWKVSIKKRLNKNNRKRAIGGGRKRSLETDQLLLLTLMYYRLYTSQEFLSWIFNINQVTVCRNILLVHPLLSKIFNIPEKKVHMEEDEILEIIYDATEQPINRPKSDQKAYYSGKKKKHTIKHQIIVNRKGKIKAVSKSFPGKTHDKKIYDESPVTINNTVDDKRDSGYQGTDLNLPHKKPKGKELTQKQKSENRLHSKKRVVVEHSFGKMKIFKIVSDKFRNPRETNHIIFKNIAGIHNMMFA